MPKHGRTAQPPMPNLHAANINYSTLPTLNNHVTYAHPPKSRTVRP